MLKGKIKALTKAVSAVLLLSLCFTVLLGAIEPNTAFAGDNKTSAVRYTVQRGDTLYIIASKFGTTVNNLKSANALSSDMIYPGQSLLIPSVSNAGVNLYTVKSGDTLYFISLRYGVSVYGLKNANNLGSDLIMPGQVLVIPGKPLETILKEKNIDRYSANFKIVVDKARHVLTLYANEIPLKSYHVELGDNGLADKKVAGDHKTPEGMFYICQKSVLSPADEYLGSRWMRLSYPNIEDAERGLSQGIIGKQIYNSILAAINKGEIPPQRTALGGGVGIHGGSTPKLGKDWTWGCIGLSNPDVEEFYEYIKVGVKVIII